MLISFVQNFYVLVAYYHSLHTHIANSADLVLLWMVDALGRAISTDSMPAKATFLTFFDVIEGDTAQDAVFVGVVTIFVVYRL